MKQSTSKRLTDILNECRKTIAYDIAGASLELGEEICREMKLQGISNAIAAKNSKESKAAFVGVLKGYTGKLTLLRMVKIARALNCDLKISLVRKPHA